MERKKSLHILQRPQPGAGGEEEQGKGLVNWTPDLLPGLGAWLGAVLPLLQALLPFHGFWRLLLGAERVDFSGSDPPLPTTTDEWCDPERDE